jgi:uncharacterized protein
MYRLQNEARRKGDPHAVYLSVAGVQNELDFVKAIYHAVAESLASGALLPRFVQRLKSRLARFLQRIESVGVPDLFEVGLRQVPPEAWENIGYELIAALRALEGQWLIMIDELPIFVLALLRQEPIPQRARTFLNWFRQVRQGL